MDLRAYQDELAELVTANGWTHYHQPRELVSALQGEAAELQDLYQWGEQPTLERLSDEAADVFIYLLRFADVTGIDLERAVATKCVENWKRPVEGARFTE